MGDLRGKGEWRLGFPVIMLATNPSEWKNKVKAVKLFRDVYDQR